MEVLDDCLWYICWKEEGMGFRGSNTVENNSTYTPSHIKSVIKNLGLNVLSESNDNLSLYCPFHNNTNTYSFSISARNGAWLCFNPSCGESGSLNDLVKKILNKNDFQALRFIMSHANTDDDTFGEELQSILEDKPEFEEFSQETLDRLHADLSGSYQAKDYFKSRGINDESMEHFWLGYSNSMGMVTTPIHGPDGTPVGLVGRSISDKRFKNSVNLPKNKTMFNIHRAKKIGSHVIIVESAFDAIRVHQAGFPNVVATLGGHISKENISSLNRYFNKLTIMTDADEAGRKLGSNISDRLKNKEVLWASYEYGKIYPHGAKDAGDMTDNEIKQCINNAVSDIEYRSWNP